MIRPPPTLSSSADLYHHLFSTQVYSVAASRPGEQSISSRCSVSTGRHLKLHYSVGPPYPVQGFMQRFSTWKQAMTNSTKRSEVLVEGEEKDLHMRCAHKQKEPVGGKF